MKKEKFVDLLAQRGLNIVSLADKSGVSRPTLYKYMHGKGNTRLDTAVKLARVLNVPPSEIMFN
nr:MAG TPA: helix-turn-helix domain protein [Caudoviricetes sp.]